MAEWGVPGYTGLRTLGSGGFGEVVLARHDASGTPVAIKYLRRNLLSDAEFTRLFRAEAAVLATVEDPHVVRLYEYVESAAGAAIVMELIDGVSLREILTRQGKTTAQAALVVLQGSLLGLAAVHRRGVVHRDYKPENVLVTGDGDSKLECVRFFVRGDFCLSGSGCLSGVFSSRYLISVCPFYPACFPNRTSYALPGPMLRVPVIVLSCPFRVPLPDPPGIAWRPFPSVI